MINSTFFQVSGSNASWFHICSIAGETIASTSSSQAIRPYPLCHRYLSLQLSPDLGIRRGRSRSVAQPSRMSGTVMGQSVLVVKAGKFSITNLLQPVKLTFKNVMQVKPQTNCAHITLENCDSQPSFNFKCTFFICLGEKWDLRVLAGCRTFKCNRWSEHSISTVFK